MENQILYTEITKAVEDIAQAIRKFSGESIFCNISVVSREKEVGEPDSYTIKVHVNQKDLPLVLSEAGYIIRDENDRIAKIERTLGGFKNDTQI